MPIGPGKYRVKTAGGTKVRLHFTPGGQVDEAKNLATGATSTPQAFAKKSMKKAPKLFSFAKPQPLMEDSDA